MRNGSLCVVAVLVACAASPSHARDLLAHADDRDLASLTLEELANVEVTTVQGTASRLQATPSALYVITAEDIRRSGHRTLAEALRMVPGMFVARGSSHFWRIGARGFTGQAISSTKQLVMIDGRVVYDPLFSGTFWDAQDVILVDVDRIEVIRGPGATLWGLNAMNGVINVITKSARETASNAVRVGSGTLEPAYASIRHGAKVGEATWYRVYGKYVEHAELESADGRGLRDAWGVVRTGVRVDHERADGVELTFTGDVYRSTRYDTVDVVPVPDAHAATTLLANDGMIGGAHLLARAARATDVDAGWTLQAYVDHTDREQSAGGQAERDTLDVDYRRWLGLGGGHSLMFGAEYFWTGDDTRGSPIVALAPSSRTWQAFNFFLQDTIDFADDRWHAMYGTKATWHDFVGWEWQPGARIWWTPSTTQTVWAAVSRPARVPSRIEADGIFTLGYVDTGLARGEPATGIYAPVTVTGSGDLEAERALTLEAGWRMQFSPRWSLDTAIFHHDYDRLIAIPASGAGAFGNGQEGRSRGIEVSSTFRPIDRWRLEGSVSWLEVETSGDVSRYEDDNTPRVLAQLRSYLDVGDRLELNAAAYYVDELPLYAIRDYTRLDLGVTWRVDETIDLTVQAQNLLEDRHRETGLAEIPRGIYAEISARW